jgi:stage V sporulation protein G
VESGAERLIWVDLMEGNEVEITGVRVFPVEDEKLKAFVSIVFDRCFMVNDIKVIRGKDGLFISMPSRRKRNGEFKDVAHPLNQETRHWVEERILAEYHATLEGKPAEASPAEPVAAAPKAVDRSLEEIEREHLNDSYWGVV